MQKDDQKTSSQFTYLECTQCAKRFSKDLLLNLCTECKKPLFARYDLQTAAQTLTKEGSPQIENLSEMYSALKSRVKSLWRYEEVLPVQKKGNIGEGWTPLIHAERLGKNIGCPNTFIKDESLNPTGSFKARGLCLAISRAFELGVKEVAIPSAGNAAGATSAYAARCGIKSHVFMPKDVPSPFIVESSVLGAEVTLVDGLITECGDKVREGVQKFGWFEVSTLREPYRVEGKKTMGYELAEQMNWTLPDVIIYATGGGTGMVGMWKAFDELEQMGLIGSKRPRMVSVQSEGCAPLVKAFQEGKNSAVKWEAAKTCAGGIRVPSAIGDFLVLKSIRESKGTAVSVSDQDMLQQCREIGKHTGIFACPEGGACLAAQLKLLKDGWLHSHETVVLFNTGSGLKYTECMNL